MGGDRGAVERRPIRVVVGEDSPVIQAMIVKALESDPEIKVVGMGSNGQAALKQVVELRPDCVTLDLDMPGMNGIEALRCIMSEWPTPVVIVSGYSDRGANIIMTCLEYGAVDFVSKTGGGNRFLAEELVAKVKEAAVAEVRRVRFGQSRVEITGPQRRSAAQRLQSAVVIGASTGGPQALMEIIPRLPRDFPAGIVVVQHMPATFTKYLAERLEARSHLDVREAVEGDALTPGLVLVAPGGKHFFLEERQGRHVVTLLEKNALQRTACPSIDFAMTSCANVFGSRLTGVILTGMGRDGCAGSAAIRRHGGTVLCQDKESSLIFGMPGAVIGDGFSSAVCPLRDIAASIARAVNETASREQVYERK